MFENRVPGGDQELMSIIFCARQDTCCNADGDRLVEQANHTPGITIAPRYDYPRTYDLFKFITGETIPPRDD